VQRTRVFNKLRVFLAQPEGERLLVDLRHVAEALNTEQRRHAATADQLVAWLQLRRVEASERPDDERARRLETDRRAITIMTIHAAKGREFPVVLLPQAADHRIPDPPAGARLVREDGRWAIDVGDPGHDSGQTVAYAQEADAEAMRLLYVGITRAQSRVVLWWAPTKTNTEHSGLDRLVQGRPGGFDPVLVETVTVGSPTPVAPPPPPAAVPVLHARPFTRAIDRDWTRTSYTGLTVDVHAQGGVVPPEPHGDEPPLDEVPASDGAEAADAGQASLFEGLGAGTQFGTIVHAVLEQVDPASSHAADDLERLCAEQARRRWMPDLDPVALARALEAVLRTPLGALADGRCLADIGLRDRLAELTFEFPLGAGDRRQTLAEIAMLFRRHVTAGDHLAHYADHLASSAAAPRVLSGFLTGSIDALLRLSDPSPRYFLIDYKTNLLPSRGRGTYHPAAMSQAMIQSHYPLQALLYAVAAHRFLASRVPGYDQARDFAGIGYLFVRGMSGPATPIVDGMPCGVFTWRPTAAFVHDASRVLAGGAP